MSGVFSPILGALVTVLAAVALGKIAFEKLGIALRGRERYALAFVTGSACLSLAIVLLATLHLARKGVFFAMAALLVAFAWRLTPRAVLSLAIRLRRLIADVLLALAGALVALAGRLEPSAARSLPVPESNLTADDFRAAAARERLRTYGIRPWLVGLLLVLTIPFAVRYLAYAWAPEVSPDGTTYHLGNVFRFWANHGFTPIRDMYGAMPEGLEMLFLMAFSIGRHSAAALVHLSFLICLPVLIVSYSLRFGFPKAGFLAAVLVFASPIMGKDASEAYNDVALATVSFGVFYAIELWIAERKGQFLIVAGVLAGFCFDIKYTGFVAAVYAFAQLLPRSIRERRFQWRTALLFAAPCVLMVAPWLVKNAVYMHNPLAPFFNSVFPNPYNSPKFEHEYSQAMAAYAGTTNVRDLAFKYTVTGTAVSGFFGPVFLLAPLGVFLLRLPNGRRLLLATLLFGLPVVFNTGTRFLIPAAPCVALAIGMAVADTKFAIPALMILHGVASWPDIADTYCDRYAPRIDEFPIDAAVNSKAALEYLHQKMGSSWDMSQILDKRMPPGGRIFCYQCPAQAYTLRDVSGYYESLEGRALSDMLWTPMETGRQPLKRITLSFAPLAATRLRVTLPQSRPDEAWSVAEMRVVREGREIPRSPHWKISASPDPWEAPFAFDNNPVSRWSAEQFGAKDAFLEVAFDAPSTVDSIFLDCPESASEQVSLQAATSGGFVPVNAAVRSVKIEPPSGMRRAAVKMLERYGFEYLMISDSGYYADDYKKYAKFWGIRGVAQAGDTTLYHLE
jgi:Dolichyl-phosphate-mannose-protein mannosyltransferase